MTKGRHPNTFRRTLPLFRNRDRDTIQRLLHHAVEDLRYDHPDRKVARDLYHEIREGEAIRLLAGPGIDNETLVIVPEEIGCDFDTILRRFVSEMNAGSEEWGSIAAELAEWHENTDSGPEMTVAFQYLH